MTDAFRDLLLPGERLLWTARPEPWAGLTPGGAVQLVVGLGALVWGLWSLLGLLIAWRATFGGIIPVTAFFTAKTVLFPVMAGLAGGFAIWGLLAPALRLRQEHYGLSAARAFFVTGSAARQVAFAADICSRGIVATERRNQVATLVLGVTFPRPDAAAEQETLRFENLRLTDFDAAVTLLRSRSGAAHG